MYNNVIMKQQLEILKDDEGHEVWTGSPEQLERIHETYMDYLAGKSKAVPAKEHLKKLDRIFFNK
jgi:hypothetical protein